MSTKTKSPSSAKKSAPTMKQCIKASAKILAKIPKPVILTLIGIVLFLIDKTAGGISTAMLYLIADDGKKSGRASGNVYMRNGRVRGFRVPALVQNDFTSAVRARLATFSSGWNGLTDAERDTWLNATGFFSSDRFGRQIQVKGKTLYVGLNQNLVNVGSTPIDVAPLAAAVVQPTSLSITADNSTPEIEATFDPDAIATSAIIVFATAPLSPGKNRPSKSAFRQISVLAGASTSPQDLTTAYTDKFGIPPVGSRVFVKMIAVNRTTGQAAPAIVASTITVA